MLVYWRQTVTKHAFDWNVLGYEVEETQRPQFIGEFRKDPLTNEIRKVYPFWRRLLRYSITIPVIALFIITMVITIIKYQEYQNQLYGDYIQSTTEQTYTSTLGLQYSQQNWSISDFQSLDFWKIVLLYPLLYSLFIEVIAALFERVAEVLNKFENHRTQSTYINRFILKVFSFRTVIIFTSLFYSGFLQQSNNLAFVSISVTMFMLMTVGQIWGIFLDIVLPLLIHKYRINNMTKKSKLIQHNIATTKTHLDRRLNPESYYVDSKGKRVYTTENLHPVQLEEGKKDLFFKQLDKREKLLLESINSLEWNQAMKTRYSCLNDYTVLIVQLGLVLLFSPVFPLAPSIAFLSNIFLIRLNAYKLCYCRQRPLAQKAGGIGVWEDILQLMSIAGILTNCALFAFTFDTISSKLSEFMLVLVLFIWEHLMLLFKYFLQAVMPKIPTRV